MWLQASKGFPDMAANEHCPYAATVYNALTGSKLPVNVICCSQRDREIFLSKLVVSWQILFNHGNEIRTFANIDLNNENPLGQCIFFLWKIIHAVTQLT